MSIYYHMRVRALVYEGIQTRLVFGCCVVLAAVVGGLGELVIAWP